MNTRAIVLIAAAAASELVGTVLLAIDQAPILSGVLIGAASAGIPAAVLLQQRLARLDTQACELDQRRAQYDAAYATLASQRERLRNGLDHQLDQQQAELTARHRRELLQARSDEYLRGVRDALSGRLAEEPQPAEARVIDLADRRQPPALVD